MDGVLGVGVAEVILIGLVLFIIGGPENTAKWARELGRWVRKAREAWQQVMKQIEEEMGEDGKEIMDATREFENTIREVNSIRSRRGMLSAALDSGEKRVTAETADIGADEGKPAESSGNGAAPVPKPASETAPISPDRYRAWLPPDTEQD